MARLSNIVINSADAYTLAQWWAPLLGGTVAGVSEPFVFVNTDSLNFLFQNVPDPTPGTRRIHFDFQASPELGREAEVARFVDAGATIVETRVSGTFSWTVMQDPEGNEFCVSDPHE